MTEEEFASKLDHWGGDFATWPPSEQAAARALVAGSPASGREWQATLAVESALPRTALRGTVDVDGLVARATSRRQERSPAIGKRLRWAAAAAVLATGFLHGALSPDDTVPPVADWFAAAFPAPPDDFDAE